MGQPTKKISALPVVTASDAADSIPIVRAGVTSRIRPGNGGGLNAGLLGAQSRDQLVPPGTINEYAGIAEPSGWFFAIGTAKARSTYSALYNALTLAKGTFTVTSATPAVFTLNAHGLATGDCVELTTTGALYTGLAANTNYFVIKIDANTFNLATTLANALAGTKIATSGSQSGVHSLRYCPWGISGASNFLLPNKREASGYGIGTRADGIVGHDAMVLGQFGDDRGQGHIHRVGVAAGVDGVVTFRGSAGSGAEGDVNLNPYSSTGMKIAISNGTDGTPRTGLSTRGKIIGVNYIVKY